MLPTDNSELYIAQKQMEVQGGWSDAGSPFCRDFHSLEDHLLKAALTLGYRADTWPNWPLEEVCPEHGLPSWAALGSPDTPRPGWQSAASTLGLSEARWPPPSFNREFWLTRRPKYVVVASGDEAKAGQQMRVVRAQALAEFKQDPTIDVLLMDGVATVGHDLSFVSDLLLMEAIPQREAWDQLISRAYRMGADIRRPITVTTMAYRGSREEMLVPDFATRCLPSAGGEVRETEWSRADGDEDSMDQQRKAVECAATPRQRKKPRLATPRAGRKGRRRQSAMGPVEGPPQGPGAAAPVAAPAAAAISAAASAVELGPVCVEPASAFKGARPGFQFCLGPHGLHCRMCLPRECRHGLGYYPTPSTLEWRQTAPDFGAQRVAAIGESKWRRRKLHGTAREAAAESLPGGAASGE